MNGLNCLQTKRRCHVWKCTTSRMIAKYGTFKHFILLINKIYWQMSMDCKCLFKIFTYDIHVNIKYLHAGSVFALRPLYLFWKNGKRSCGSLTSFFRWNPLRFRGCTCKSEHWESITTPLTMHNKEKKQISKTIEREMAQVQYVVLGSDEKEVNEYLS